MVEVFTSGERRRAMAIIAISRGTFSGGEALAERVADRLGYACLSRETNLEEAAQTYGVPAADLVVAMEKRPSFLQRVLGQRTAHLAVVRATLCAHAQADNLVYHGLAGHLLLPGIAHVIRVRVIADLDYRVKAARHQRELGPAEALAYIDKVDRERRQWVRFLFEVEWDDPHFYDLILNLSRVSLGTACETVARLAEQDEFKATAASRQAMDNLALASRVRARLAIDSRTRDVELEVVAEGGIVTISGQTQSPAVDRAIETVARAVDGVMEVRSKVVVVPVYPGT
jgi:cytidylate kinase